MTIGTIISDILVREGGYVDRSEDKGGPTKFGITLATLAEWRGKPCTAQDVRELQVAEAEAIYRDRYIVRPGFVGLPDPLRGLVVDCGVNHGTDRATRWLQKAAGVAQDGQIGPDSEKAIASCDPAALYRKVLAARVRFYGRIITDNATQAVFAAGWANRAASFIDEMP